MRPRHATPPIVPPATPAFEELHHEKGFVVLKNQVRATRCRALLDAVAREDYSKRESVVFNGEARVSRIGASTRVANHGVRQSIVSSHR